MDAALKQARESSNLSTSELALRLGVAQSTVVRLEQSAEKGTITLNALEKAAAAMGCKVECRITPPKKRANKYRGMKRTSRTAVRESAISEAMKADERNLNSALTPEERVLRACRLSDFLRSMR